MVAAVHTGHRNDMTTWSDIACQRGHASHASRLVDVTIGEHGYHDLPAIPARFARSFEMMLWDAARYRAEQGGYCPAADAVSETILSERVWEPAETILTLAVCESAAACCEMPSHQPLMVDIGAQIGWFSLLAASCGLNVLAIDADQENLRLLSLSAAANDWAWLVAPLCDRIGPDSAGLLPDVPIRLAKIDVEGAEDEAVRILWPAIEAGRVDHLLIEVSPVFADYYPALVQRIIDAGYRAYRLPEKARPPARLDDIPFDLEPGRLDTFQHVDLADYVASCHQMNVWFAREGASW